MGFNTTLVVMNDSLHEIEKDPEFGKKVAQAIMMVQRGKPVDISSGGHVNAATAIETHHADGLEVLAVGGNHATMLGYGGGYRSTPEEILKTLADQMGYRLVKKAKPPQRTEP